MNVPQYSLKFIELNAAVQKLLHLGGDKLVTCEFDLCVETLEEVLIKYSLLYTTSSIIGAAFPAFLLLVESHCWKYYNFGVGV